MAQAVDTCTSAPASPCVSIWFDNMHSPNLVDTTKAVGQQIVAEVNITGTSAINAFDITVYYDPSYLAAQRLSFTASSGDGIVSLFQGHTNFILANDTTSFTNSAELALSSVDTVPGQGMLFSVVFNVVASTSSGPTAIFFSSGTTTVNNGADIIPANLRDGSFSNIISAGFIYSLSVSPTSATIVQAGSASATVTATLIQGTSRSITLSTTVTGPACTAPNCPVATLGTTTGTPTFTSALSITTTSSTPTGVYTIAINGSADDVSARSTAFTLTVAVHDVAVTALTSLTAVGSRTLGVTVLLINATVSNAGTVKESFPVNLKVNSNDAGTQTATVDPGSSQKLSFSVDTATPSYGLTPTESGAVYPIEASAVLSPGTDSNPSDNTRSATLTLYPYVDVAVTSVTLFGPGQAAGATQFAIGTPVTVHVTVTNNGDGAANTSLFLSASRGQIEDDFGIVDYYLPAHSTNDSVTFKWDTTGRPSGSYLIDATLSTFSAHGIKEPTANNFAEVTANLVVPLNRGSIKVTVKDVNGKPVSGATVTLFDSSGKKVTSGTTDASGTLNFIDLTDGNYVVETTASGSATSRSTVTLQPGTQLGVSVNLQPSTAGGLDLTTTLGGLLAGLVVAVAAGLFIRSRRKKKEQ